MVASRKYINEKRLVLTKKVFANSLKTLREAGNLYQQQAAEYLREKGFKVSYRTYQNWEQGSTMPDPETASEVLEALEGHPDIPRELVVNWNAQAGSDENELREQDVTHEDLELVSDPKRRYTPRDCMVVFTDADTGKVLFGLSPDGVVVFQPYEIGVRPRTGIDNFKDAED